MILEITSNTITGTEPTNLVDAQLYFRSEDSNGIEDDLIQSFLSQAREAIETSCNISLISRSVEVYLDEYIGYLPYGPIDTTSYTVVSGTASKKGSQYPYINESADAVVTYDCIAVFNPDLINAIYELASFWYFRGDMNDKAMPEKVFRVIKRYSRNVFV
jgi:hypothetical protein